jgi:hypothetical protein
VIASLKKVGRMYIQEERIKIILFIQLNDFIISCLLSFMHKLTAYIGLMAILLTSAIGTVQAQLIDMSKVITPNNTNPFHVDNGSLLFDEEQENIDSDSEDDNDDN